MKEIFYVLKENKTPCRANGEVKKFASKDDAVEWAQKQKDFIGFGRYYVADWLETVLFEV